MKKPKPRMNRWTEAQKEWLGYKRRMATLDKKDVSLSEAPWEEEAEEEDVDNGG